MNIAIIGTGKIVHEALPVIVGTEGVVVRSIWCREHSLAKAEALAAQFGIPQVAPRITRIGGIPVCIDSCAYND